MICSKMELVSSLLAAVNNCDITLKTFLPTSNFKFSCSFSDDTVEILLLGLFTGFKMAQQSVHLRCSKIQLRTSCNLLQDVRICRSQGRSNSTAPLEMEAGRERTSTIANSCREEAIKSVLNLVQKDKSKA